jgi:hypothetical protein
MILVAVDTQVSKSAQYTISNKFKVVFRAPHGMTDDAWIEKALDLGANVFVSPDLDIPLYLDTLGVDYKWIDLPQSMKSSKQANYILKRLKAIG